MTRSERRPHRTVETGKVDRLLGRVQPPPWGACAIVQGMRRAASVFAIGTLLVASCTSS